MGEEGEKMRNEGFEFKLVTVTQRHSGHRSTTDLIGKTDSPIRLSKRPTSLASHSNTRAVTIPVLERRTWQGEKEGRMG